MVTELTFTLTVINTRAIGIEISNSVWGLTFILTETFIKDNGKTVSQTVREIIYTKVVKLFIKEIGKMVKNKDLDS